MRRILTRLAAPVLALALAMPAAAAPTLDPAKMPAGTYVLDKRHASLVAKVRHMGLSNYAVRFNVFDATFDYDPKNPAASKVEVMVDVNSIDVGNAEYSSKFAKDFLDGGDNPVATFVSTKLTPIDATRGVMEGELTLRGITRPVSLNVAFGGYSASVVAGQRVGFAASGQIDRTEFGSTFLSPEIVGDKVDIFIDAEFTKE